MISTFLERPRVIILYEAAYMLTAYKCVLYCYVRNSSSCYIYCGMETVVHPKCLTCIETC